MNSCYSSSISLAASNDCLLDNQIDAIEEKSKKRNNNKAQCNVNFSSLSYDSPSTAEYQHTLKSIIDYVGSTIKSAVESKDDGAADNINDNDSHDNPDFFPINNITYPNNGDNTCSTNIADKMDVDSYDTMKTAIDLLILSDADDDTYPTKQNIEVCNDHEEIVKVGTFPKENIIVGHDHSVVPSNLIDAHDEIVSDSGYLDLLSNIASEQNIVTRKNLRPSKRYKSAYEKRNDNDYVHENYISHSIRINGISACNSNHISSLLEGVPFSKVHETVDAFLGKIFKKCAVRFRFRFGLEGYHF